MNFTIKHEVTVVANSEAEATQVYVLGWRNGVYTQADLDVEEQEKKGKK